MRLKTYTYTMLSVIESLLGAPDADLFPGMLIKRRGDSVTYEDYGMGLVIACDDVGFTVLWRGEEPWYDGLKKTVDIMALSSDFKWKGLLTVPRLQPAFGIKIEHPK